VAAPTLTTATPPASFARRLQLLFVVGRIRLVHLTTNLLTTSLDSLFVALSNNRSVVLGDRNPTGFTTYPAWYCLASDLRLRDQLTTSMGMSS